MSESIGKTLKRIRESRRLSIEDVSERTRISKKIISEIEEDRLKEISSAFYARGFVKAYSQFLGALEEKAIEEYLSRVPKKDTPTLVVKGVNVPPGEWLEKHKKHIGLAILVIFSAWALVFGFVHVSKFIGNIVANHKAQVAEKKAKALLPPQAPRNIKVSAPKKIAKKEFVQLEIEARYNTWIRVVGDGKLLFGGVLRKGSKDIWQAKEKIKLELGNAGGVRLKINEEDIGSLGRKGEKKEVIITKDGLKL
ncbi:helix-turn-helix domain-containing protein [Candidatus Omnitrophota bacterium]